MTIWWVGARGNTQQGIDGAVSGAGRWQLVVADFGSAAFHMRSEAPLCDHEHSSPSEAMECPDAKARQAIYLGLDAPETLLSEEDLVARAAYEAWMLGLPDVAPWRQLPEMTRKAWQRAVAVRVSAVPR